jgi:ubiquinone/menaquinone biosynthesis C-methylase UbiE
MMKAIADPEGAELSHLVAACPLDGRSVLEVGCGPGTLTWQYAGLPRRVVALDPDASVLRQAEIDRPAASSNVTFLQAVGEALPTPSRTFDTVLFSSSF